MSRINALLDAAAALPGPAPYTFAHEGGAHGFHLVLSALVHGDEVGPLPAFLAMANALREGRMAFGGRLTLVLGNPEAARAGQRFIEEDLNRVWVDGPDHSVERRRARQLRPVLERADLFLDFHQVSLDCAHGFWTLPWSPEAQRWTRALRGAPAWVTRAPGQSFAPGLCCADEFVRNHDRPGLTLELGRKGLREAHEHKVIEVAARLMSLVDACQKDPEALPRAAAEAPEVTMLVTAHQEPFVDPAQALKPGMRYFMPVAAGEALEAPGAPPLSSPIDGALIFQKYLPRDAEGRAIGPLPQHIFNVVRPLGADPQVLWG